MVWGHLCPEHGTVATATRGNPAPRRRRTTASSSARSGNAAEQARTVASGACPLPRSYRTHHQRQSSMAHKGFRAKRAK